MSRLYVRIKISINIDISVIGFSGYIGEYFIKILARLKLYIYIYIYIYILNFNIYVHLMLLINL